AALGGRNRCHRPVATVPLARDRAVDAARRGARLAGARPRRLPSRPGVARRAARLLSAIGVGVDLVEVSRVAAIIADKGARVFERLLTPTERAYCESRPDPATHVAVRLAAKEAVYKALQGSEAARGIGWREVEVTRTPGGRPDVRLTGFAAARAEQLGVERVLLSLSHTHQAAVAVVVLERG